MIGAIAGLATILLTGLAAYLIREIRHRTSQEIALADERDKLQAASDRLKADIVLRKEVEQKLRETQATLRDAVDSISEGFVIYDRDDCFVMCNEPYRRLYPKAARLIVSTKYRCHRLCHLQMSLLDGGVGRRVGAEPPA